MPGVRDRGGEVQKGSVVLECGGAEGVVPQILSFLYALLPLLFVCRFLPESLETTDAET